MSNWLVFLVGPLGKGWPWIIRGHHLLPVACQLCCCILSSILHFDLLALCQSLGLIFVWTFTCYLGKNLRFSFVKLFTWACELMKKGSESTWQWLTLDSKRATSFTRCLPALLLHIRSSIQQLMSYELFVKALIQYLYENVQMYWNLKYGFSYNFISSSTQFSHSNPI